LGKIKWYKRDPDAALAGFFELSLEERGAYGTVIDLIYSRANDLPDDDRFIAGWLGADVRVWKRIKKRLVATGKIKISNGKITNKRATSEILKGLHRIAVASEAGRTSRPKSASVTNEIKDIDVTDAKRTPELTTTTTTKNNKKVRLPADWKPKKTDVERAFEKGNGHKQIIALVEGFKSHWAEATGVKASKTNWDRAFQNWTDNDIKFNGPPNLRPGSGGKLTRNQIAG